MYINIYSLMKKRVNLQKMVEILVGVDRVYPWEGGGKGKVIIREKGGSRAGPKIGKGLGEIIRTIFEGGRERGGGVWVGALAEGFTYYSSSNFFVSFSSKSVKACWSLISGSVPVIRLRDNCSVK